MAAVKTAAGREWESGKKETGQGREEERKGKGREGQGSISECRYASAVVSASLSCIHSTTAMLGNIIIDLV
eukprot:Skav211247  [mRNA]  locus=scaffold3676:1260:1472:- [translate_table: standard]